MTKKKLDLYFGIVLIILALFQLLGIFSMFGVGLSQRFFYILLAVTGVYLIFKGK
ncbi:MAG: hypothetical protein ACQESF_00040 [Nanobdellota archaeon]